MTDELLFLTELRQKFCLVPGGCNDEYPCWWCGKFLEIYEEIEKIRVSKIQRIGRMKRCKEKMIKIRSVIND